MEPLNAQERTAALFKFLGLFLVTILLVCGALYFDWEGVPAKQMEYLKMENARLSTANTNTRMVLLTIDSIRSGLARFQSDPNRERVALEINQGTIALTKYAGTDTSYYSRIIARVADSYSLQLVDKKNLIASGNCSETVANLKKEVDDKTQEIKDLNRDLDELRLRLRTATNY